MLAIKQLPRSPGSQTSEEIDYFKAVFLLKTATKTRPSVRDEFLTSREKPGYQATDRNNKLCTQNELKCYRKTV